MLSPRIDLGIAQTVFYVPVVPIAIYLFIRNFKHRPKMAWWPMIPLSLIRLAGGIVTIVFEKKPSIGLFIAALVLLNVGAIPLLVATLGQIRIILIDNYSHNPHSTTIAQGIRLASVVAVALLVAGGAIVSDNEHTGRILSLVGYIVFAVVLATLIAMELWFFRKQSELTPSSRKVLRGNMIAAPFLIIRTVYGILEVAFSFESNSIWNPLTGNIYAFCFMCLFVEYICVGIYFWLGFSMPPDRGVTQPAQAQEPYNLK